MTENEVKDLLKTLLRADTESEVLEFKEAKKNFSKDDFGKYFSALSNEANLADKAYSWILFGIGNQKQIVGTSISEAQLNEYKLEISNHTSPILSFLATYRCRVDGKDVILFQIPAAPQGIPVAWKGHFYGRSGESLVALDIGEIERIRNQNKKKDWSAQIADGATLDDLSEEAVSFARVQFAKKNPHLEEDMKHWSDETFLNKAKLCIRGKVTNSALLLLGKPESHHFLSPAVAKMTWILRDKDGVEVDYEHFSCPFILAVGEVHSKIRNLKYRYIQDGTLFPEEVLRFDPFIIRESLNNCIVHQDYSVGGKINIVEYENGVLVLSNSGDFIPKTIENVLKNDAPESVYRNPFLAEAMVNLNMIDTIGSGIKKMFVLQKNKFFPLPDYDFSNNEVKVKIIGKVVDMQYARKLAQMPDLELSDIILLDRVQKKLPINDEAFKYLKSKKLIEGRKNNYTISAEVAKITHQETDYMNKVGIDDDYCKKMILDYIRKFGSAKKSQLEEFLLPKLSENLSEQQKKDKIKNILQTLKKEQKITVNPNSSAREWIMSNLDEI